MFNQVKMDILLNARILQPTGKWIEWDIYASSVIAYEYGRIWLKMFMIKVIIKFIIKNKGRYITIFLQ